MTRRRSDDRQLHILSSEEVQSTIGPAVSAAFEPARLTQARHLAGMTKTAVAEALGVSAVAVGQWEAGTHPPRPDDPRGSSPRSRRAPRGDPRPARQGRSPPGRAALPWGPPTTPGHRRARAGSPSVASRRDAPESRTSCPPASAAGPAWARRCASDPACGGTHAARPRPDPPVAEPHQSRRPSRVGVGAPRGADAEAVGQEHEAAAFGRSAVSSWIRVQSSCSRTARTDASSGAKSQ